MSQSFSTERLSRSLAMFDIDKLIQCVQQEPALWEIGSEQYMDRTLKDRKWLLIGEKMFSEWQEFTDAEREEQVKMMKVKWRNIRDCYSKFINQGRSGDAANVKKKKYVYADALTFLLHTMQKRKTSGNVREEEDEEDIDVDSISTQEGADEATQVQERPTTSNEPPKRKSVKSHGGGITNFQSQLLAKLDEQKTHDEDADKAYLLSILPEFKKLNDDQKLDFRFHTLQFFRDIRRCRHTENPQRNVGLHHQHAPYSPIHSSNSNSPLPFLSQYQNRSHFHTAQHPQYFSETSTPWVAPRHDSQDTTSPPPHTSDDSFHSNYDH